MSNFEPADAPPPLAPRLSNVESEPPFNPSSYFFVGFFAGILPLIYLSVLNVDRISRSSVLRSRTMLLSAATIAVAIAMVLFGPEAWLLPNRDLRLTLRIVAVISSMGMYRLHTGAATARALGSSDFAKAWKKWAPIIALSVLQGILTFGLMKIRGLR